ncbi:MAG: 3-hydroxyacyl-CoA dehydrogenase NAD-binding domain-containing protein [Actinomycetota bacterium]
MRESIDTVGVLGSGIMGAGLVEVAARSGRQAVLRSRTTESAERALAQVAKGLDKQVAKEKITPDERDAILGRITATDDIDALGGCDLVIESVVEDLDVKKDLFRRIDAVVGDGAVLATNTSTLPIVEIAMVTQRPEAVCGIHFFNPAPMMKLVEVIRPITAADETIKTAMIFAESCG